MKEKKERASLKIPLIIIKDQIQKKIIQENSSSYLWYFKMVKNLFIDISWIDDRFSGGARFSVENILRAIILNKNLKILI